MCLAVTAAAAQGKAGIEVGYSAFSPDMRSGTKVVEEHYVLLANPSESKFYSPMTEYIDSLNSTPEGAARYREMALGAYLGNKMKDMPRRGGSCYVMKSFPANKMSIYDTAGLDKFCYDEQPEAWDWAVGDSTKNILGYECVEASAEYHGRRWTVWFAPDIPVQNGPWKFGGLPGLILEAVSDGSQYRFAATDIRQTDKAVLPPYLAAEYEKTTRKDFLKNKRSFQDNTLNRLNVQLGGGTKVLKVMDEDGKDISDSMFASRETVDFIETDY